MPDAVTPPEPQKQPEAKPSRIGAIAEQLRRDMDAQTGINTGQPIKAPPAPEAPPAQPTDRDAHGRFVKKEEPPPAEDPNKAAMRELIKRQKAQIREQEKRMAELERRFQPMAPQAPPPDPEAELLSTMPEETRTWWKNTGDRLVDIRINKVLSAKDAEIARLEAAKQAQDAGFDTAFDDFVADRLVEGEVVDERKFYGFLDEIESNGWRFGRDDSTHIEQAYKMFRKANAGAVTPVRTAEDAEKAAAEAARNAARSGGTPPSTQAPPQMDRGEYGRKLREAVLRGDHAEKSRLMRERLRGTVVDQVFNPRAGQEG